MKQVLSCVVLIAFACIHGVGQDKQHLDISGFREPEAPDSKREFGLRSASNWKPADHLRNPFDAQVESLSSASNSSQKDAPSKQQFNWSGAVKQSLLFLGIQHGYAFTQPKTRRDLKGPFFKDYARSVKSLHGWGDGGRFFTNYIAHPMQGALLGFIQVQNDPKGKRLRFNESGAYWRSRAKALAWASAWSTQFEIGPISQASIGNVGLHGKQTYVDLVITPTAGTGLLILEDFLDEKVIKKLEQRNYYLKISSRMLLNPSRSVANLLRFKAPWYRDSELRVDLRTFETSTPTSSIR